MTLAELQSDPSFVRHQTIPRPGVEPWLEVAKNVLAGKYRKADDSTRESIRIGLRNIDDPDCKRAMELLDE